MSKALRTVGMVVGAVALIAATAGLAAPAVAATATTAATAGGVLGVSAATLAAIGTYGSLAAGVLSMAAGAMAPGFSAEGSPTTFTTNPQSGLPYAVGRTRMSGLRAYARTYDGFKQQSKDDILAFVVMLSIAGPIHSIEKFTADNEVVTFESGGTAIGRFDDYMSQKVSLGAPGAAALDDEFGGKPYPDWTANHKLSGIAHAQWALRFDTDGDLYGAGAPEPAWTGKWVKVYDPRKDSTYPGGSGSHRALNEATYEWSDNPGLHALTWALGRWQNGKRVCGIGAPVANIRVAEFVECANVCEANSWRVGGVEWTTDSKWDTMKRILQAGGAIPTQTGAMIGCLVSTPRTAIATIESRHLHDGLSFASTKSRRDRFNTVIPRYVDEDSDWAVISGTAVTESAYVTDDGGQRTKEIDFPLVQVFSGETAEQPGQLAAYAIVNSREGGPFTWTTGPEWIGLKTGDVVYLNVPEEGLVNQPVLITRRAPDPATGKVSFSGETETYSKHAYALGQSTTPPAPFSLSAPDLKPAAPLSANWGISGATSGEGFPALLVTGESEMPSADAVVIDYRKSGDAVWISSAILSAVGPVSHTIAPLDSETAYDVRIGYRVGTSEGNFTLFANVTTGLGKVTIIEQQLSDFDAVLEQLEADTATALTNIAAAQVTITNIQADATVLQAEVTQAAANIVAQGAAITAQGGVVSALTAEVTQAQADIVAQGAAITAAAGDITALTDQVGAVTADLGDLATQVSAAGGEIDALQTTVGTQGASITGLQTTVSNHTGTLATHTSQISTANANISANATAITTANTNIANLTVRVGSAESTITSSATAITNLTGRTATLETTVSSQGASITSLQTTTSTHTGQIATINSTLTTQGASVTANSSAITTLQGSVASLTAQVSASSNANLLENGGFENGLTGWNQGGTGTNWVALNLGNFGSYVRTTTVTSAAFSLWKSVEGIQSGAEYTLAADLQLHATSADIALRIQWRAASGAEITPPAVGPTIAVGTDFSTSDINRQAYKVTAVAPAGASSARCYLYGNSGASGLTYLGIRQIKFERGSIATPYSGEATVNTLYTAYSGTAGQLATLSTTVSTQGASITSLQSASSTQSGQIAALTTNLSTANASISTNATAISTANTNIANLTTRVGTAEAAITTNASAITTLQGNVATLTTQVTASNANLCPGFENGLSNWTQSGASFSVFNDAGWGPFAFSSSNPVNGASMFVRSPAIPIAGGATYTVTADAASSNTGGTTTAFLQFEWRDASNNPTFSSGPGKASSFGFTTDGTNRSALKLTATAPGNAVSVLVKVVWQKVSGTSTISSVRQIKFERGSLATPFSQEASVYQSFQAISTLDGQYASLSTTVSTQGASITSLQSASSTQAGQITTLTTSLSTANANISTNTSAISGLNTSVATINSTLTTQGASITTMQTAITTLQGQTATLTTQVTAGSANLCPGLDSGLSDWTQSGAAWSIFNDAGWGPFAHSNTNPANGASVFLRSPVISIAGNTAYTVTADVAAINTGGTTTAFLQFEWKDAGGVSTFTSGPGKASNFSLSADGTNRAALKLTATAPSSAVSVMVKVVWQKVSGASTAIQVRQIKLERGSVATPFSQEASVYQSFQTLSTLATQYASLSSTVSTQGVTITTQQTAITTINGNITTLFGRAGVTVDVNGVVTGWEVNNNGTVGEFAVRSNRFKVLPPSGTTDGFYIDFDGSNRTTQYIRSGSVRVVELGWIA